MHSTHSSESETKTNRVFAAAGTLNYPALAAGSIAAIIVLLGPHLICVSMSVTLMASANSATDMALAALLITVSGSSLVLGLILSRRLSAIKRRANTQSTN